MVEQSGTQQWPRAKRLVFIDNAKFLALVILIWMHLSFGTFWTDWPHTSVAKVLKFVVALLCMVSGAWTSRRQKGNAFWRAFLQLAAPLLVWRCLTPTAWHIQVLLVWRCASRSWQSLSLWLQGAIVWSLAIGSVYLGLVVPGKTSQALTLQAGTLFPFYFLGQTLDWHRVAAWKASLRWSTIVWNWLLFLALVVAYVVIDPFVDVVSVLEPFFNDNYMNACINDCVRPWLWARYLALFCLRSAQSLWFILFCVPTGTCSFSEGGAHTLYPALLHFPAVLVAHRLFKPVWDAFRASLVSSAMPLASAVVFGLTLEFLLLLLALAATYALSARRTRRFFQWFIEPVAFFCPRRSAKDKTEE